MNHIIGRRNKSNLFFKEIMNNFYLPEFFVGEENYGLEVFEHVGNEKTLFSLLDILQSDREFDIFGNLCEEWLKFRKDEARVRTVVEKAYGMSLEELKTKARPIDDTLKEHDLQFFHESSVSFKVRGDLVALGLVGRDDFVSGAISVHTEQLLSKIRTDWELFDSKPSYAAVQKRYEEHSAEALPKITQSPYIDWGEKKLERSGGFAKGSWSVKDKSKERMFIFKSDIEFAKECLRRDYEEATEELAIMQLCDARRTGNRRFPRFGWIWPQQCCILGRKELLKHPGKKSEWNSLYAIVSASALDDPLKKSILSKIDSMKQCDSTNKPLFKGNTLKNVQIKSHYQVHLDKAEMEAVLPLITEAAIPVYKRWDDDASSDDGDDFDENFSFENMTDAGVKAFLDDMGDSVLERLASTMKQKQIVDAISTIYKKFPVESFKDFELFSSNREFWETYDPLKNGVRGLGVADLSHMASAVLAEMAKYRGTNGVTFFNGNAKITEKSGICYIEDYAMTPDVAKYYREQYLPKLRFNAFTNGQGRMCMNVNDNEYTDLFAAGLLKAMFGNGKGYSVGGPIDTLAGYVEFIKQLAKHFDQVQKLVPELSSSSDDLLKSENRWPNISIENLLLLLGDIAEYRNPVKIPEGYTALVYALLVSAYPNYEDRFNFLENKSLFYTKIDVENGADANRKFKSDYVFVDETSASNRFAAIERNCIVLDRALRNSDMPVWSAAIMAGLLKSSKDNLTELFELPGTAESGIDVKIGTKELISRKPTVYSYLECDADYESEISLGESIDKFLGQFYGLGTDLSLAISSAEGDRARIAEMARCVSEKESRFVNDINSQTKDMAVVQFNFSTSRPLTRLNREKNILTLN